MPTTTDIRPGDIVLHTHRGTEHRVLSVDGDLLQLEGIFPRTPLGMVEFLDRPIRWYVFDGSNIQRDDEHAEAEARP